MNVERQVLAGGDVRISAGGGVFLFSRLRKGVLVVTISGSDMGQFGQCALDEIRAELQRHSPLQLFVDAEQVELISVEVSKEWTQFMSGQRPHLARVSVLTGTRLVNLIVAIAQHMSRTGNLIQIYSDRGLFEAALERA